MDRDFTVTEIDPLRMASQMANAGITLVCHSISTLFKR